MTADGRFTRAAYNPLYRIWNGMIARCYDRRSPSYRNYGAKGIAVCDRWHVFESFVEDVGLRPDGLTMDRIDPRRGYEPGNVRWASRKEQVRRRPVTRTLSVQGKEMSVGEAAEQFNLPHWRIRTRLNAGWSGDEAVSRPVRAWKRRGH